MLEKDWDAPVDICVFKGIQCLRKTGMHLRLYLCI